MPSHTSGNLFGVGVRKGHFTHIVLDEAAQMMEAEALIPLSVADNRCVIIMAGDVKQLGPHVQSPSCRVYVLFTSLNDNLLTSVLFCRHGLGKSIMVLPPSYFSLMTRELTSSVATKGTNSRSASLCAQ